MERCVGGTQVPSGVPHEEGGVACVCREGGVNLARACQRCRRGGEEGNPYVNAGMRPWARCHVARGLHGAPLSLKGPARRVLDFCLKGSSDSFPRGHAWRGGADLSQSQGIHWGWVFLQPDTQWGKKGKGRAARRHISNILGV